MEDHYGDFVEFFGGDLSAKILSYLDDPDDLVRFSSVSKDWNQFAIDNFLSWKLCSKRFPELASEAHQIELNNVIESYEYDQDLEDPQKFLMWKNWLFGYLARGLSPVIRNDCISGAISASSTDNYPIESIRNTLESGCTSYWSSKGTKIPEAPEYLLYELSSKLCIVSEIHVQPFRAFFQDGFPIYSCKAIRFRVGHVRDQGALEHVVANYDYIPNDDRLFIWRYISPTFPVVQKSTLQKFKLPEPALCVGGFLLVELLGRDQIQDIDGLYYICIAHVQLVGRPLLPPFDVEMLSSGKYYFRYNPKPSSSGSALKSPIREVGLPSRLRAILTIFPRFLTKSLHTIISILQTFANEDELEDENP